MRFFHSYIVEMAILKFTQIFSTVVARSKYAANTVSTNTKLYLP